MVKGFMRAQVRLLVKGGWKGLATGDSRPGRAGVGAEWTSHKGRGRGTGGDGRMVGPSEDGSCAMSRAFGAKNSAGLRACQARKVRATCYANGTCFVQEPASVLLAIDFIQSINRHTQGLWRKFPTPML